MENIINNLKAALSTETANGRMIRTFVQAFVGVGILASAVVALPEFQSLMRTIGLAGQMTAAAAFVASMSRLMSAAESLYEKARKWADGEKTNTDSSDGRAIHRRRANKRIS